MKFSPRDLDAFVASPGKQIKAMLLYGPDESLVADRRAAIIKSVLDDPDDPFLLTRLSKAEIREQVCCCADALRILPMTAGRAVILLEEATEAERKALELALEVDGPSLLLVTAGSLKPSSGIRKLFEAGKDRAACACYPQAWNSASMTRTLESAGITGASPDAISFLVSLAGDEKPGSLEMTRRLIEKLAIFLADKDEPLSEKHIELCIGSETDTNLDRLTEAVAGGQARRVPSIFAQLLAQGKAPAAMLAYANYHFLRLARVKAEQRRGKDLRSSLLCLRPPVFARQRTILTAQCQRWSENQLWKAIELLHNCEAKIRRGGVGLPAKCFIERALVKISMMKTGK